MSQNNPSEDKVMTIEMVAEFLQVTRQHVHSLIKNEGLPSIKKGRSRRILKSSLLEWLKKDER